MAGGYHRLARNQLPCPLSGRRHAGMGESNGSGRTYNVVATRNTDERSRYLTIEARATVA
jgi:hypothetical protein